MYNFARNIFIFTANKWHKRLINNQKAASLYLKAAELYRKSLDSKPNEAASVLYSAAEAYKAAGKIAEAQEISNLLSRLYPDSAYANRARSLLK